MAEELQCKGNMAHQLQRWIVNSIKTNQPASIHYGTDNQRVYVFAALAENKHLDPLYGLLQYL